MKVILQESYMNLGEAGDIVNVKPGYARNFLIPQRIAASATAANVRLAEDKQKELEAKKIKEREKSEKLKEQLQDSKITIVKKVGDDGKLFGSVTSKEIEENLAERGIAVDRRMIVLGQQIKLTGTYEILVKLVGGKKIYLPLDVVPEETEKKAD
ncbi:50S ribosomal protein L9 [bacterium]|nr:50S ribosomal protein L9 [bacterium]